MANPAQDRIALDFPELRIAAVKQQLLELFTQDYFNNPSFSPTHQPDVTAWYPDSSCVFDVSRPHERRTWIWIAQKLQFIKTGMTSLLANFMRSGNLAADADDHVRDLKFFQDFSHQQPLWFWIYMCWDHGRNVPAWNTSLLPEDMRMDIGAGAEGDDDASSDVAKRSASLTADGPSSGKKKKTTAAAQDDPLTSLIQVSLPPSRASCLTHVTQVSHHLMTNIRKHSPLKARSHATQAPKKAD